VSGGDAVGNLVPTTVEGLSYVPGLRWLATAPRSAASRESQRENDGTFTGRIELARQFDNSQNRHTFVGNDRLR
jgi:hypothetical protein